MASEDQLSGNTFAFAHVARTPFRSLPGFTGAEHEVRQLSAPVEHGALHRGTHSPGAHVPWAPGFPKPSEILLQCAQIISSPVLGESAKARVFSSPWLTLAGSNPFCLLTFSLIFLLDPCPSPPSSLRASVTPWSALSALCPSHSFTCCSGVQGLVCPDKISLFSAISPGIVPSQLASVRKWLYLAWSITLVLIIKSRKRKKRG